MKTPRGTPTRLLRGLRAAVLAAAAALPAAGAATGSHLAAVVVDAHSGKVLHAANANRRVRPASLTKLMTTLLVLEHLAASGDAPATAWPVTANAAGQPATRLGLHAGRAVSAGTVLDALLVASANDAAVVAAEAIDGSETAFAEHMNRTASRLGLTGTRFANASGLPASAQYTTARDMAVLALHLWQRFPAERPRFARSGMQYAGRWIGTHNPLIGSYRGAGGMKTGFTCRAGFNLVGLAERDGRAVIAVVLGAPTREGRNALVRDLLDRAFSRPAPRDAPTLEALAGLPGQGAGDPVHGRVIARTCLGIIGSDGEPSRWNIEVGVKRTRKEAREAARDFIRTRRKALPGARVFSIPRYTGVELHRAIVTGVSEAHAREACLAFREGGGGCVIFGPDAATLQLEDAARIRDLQEHARTGMAKATEVKGRVQ